MQLLSPTLRTHVAAVTIAATLTSPLAPLVGAQAAGTATPAAAPPATAKPVAAAQAAPVPPDGDWPHAYTTKSGAALLVYQPQVSSWVDQKKIVAYSAVS